MSKTRPHQSTRQQGRPSKKAKVGSNKRGAGTLRRTRLSRDSAKRVTDNDTVSSDEDEPPIAMDSSRVEALEKQFEEQFEEMRKENQQMEGRILNAVRDMMGMRNAHMPTSVCGHNSDGSPSSRLTDSGGVISSYSDRSSLPRQQREVPKASRDALRSYLRFSWYGRVKFMTDEQAGLVLSAGKRENKIDQNITTCKQVQCELGSLRQNSRSGAKTCFIGKNLLSVLNHLGVQCSIRSFT